MQDCVAKIWRRRVSRQFDSDGICRKFLFLRVRARLLKKADYEIFTELLFTAIKHALIFSILDSVIHLSHSKCHIQLFIHRFHSMRARGLQIPHPEKKRPNPSSPQAQSNVSPHYTAVQCKQSPWRAEPAKTTCLLNALSKQNGKLKLDETKHTNTTLLKSMTQDAVCWTPKQKYKEKYIQKSIVCKCYTVGLTKGTEL